MYKVLGMFGGEEQGRRRRRYITVPQSNNSIIPMHKDQVGSTILFFFFSVYRRLGSNKQIGTLSYKILLLKILYNQNNQRNNINLLNPSIMS